MPFTASVQTLSSIGPQNRISSSRPVSPVPEGHAAAGAAREFEALVLQTFVQDMLPREAESVFGSGTASAFWRSMLAEQIAKELARSGGVGIADMITRDIATSSGDHR